MKTRHALASAVFVLAIAAAGAAQTARSADGVPRTPWGDPDLQGVWDYWTFTPLERPKEYANRPTLTDAEHAELLKRLGGQAAAADARAQAPGDPGSYSQEVWTDRARGTALKQTSIIIDPPDGKIPPMTPEAQQRAAAHKAAGGHPVRMRTDGVADHNPEDRGLSERCLLGFSTGPPFQPGGYNNNVQIVQTPGYVVLLLEMNHDARIVPIDGRRPPAAAHHDVARRLARPLGGQHARRSRPRTSRPRSRLSARASVRAARVRIGREPPPHRTLHARRRQDPRITSSRSTIRRRSPGRSPAGCR